MASKTLASDAPLLQWLATHPDDVSTRMYLADAYLYVARRKEAIDQYNVIIRAQPRNGHALNNLAMALYQEGNSEALRYAHEAFQVSPSAVTADTLGLVLVQQRKLEQGISFLSQAVAMAPNAPEIRYHLADALARAGRRNEARRELELTLQSGAKFKELSAARELMERLGGG